ncbi:MAG: insulinase family protein [Bacteroidetes bacterium]|nr:insulinase family protein [Bacteroidota bacterium]
MSHATRTSVKTHQQVENAHYRKTTLDNGIRVVSENIPHVRSVSLGIWANVGSRDEAPAENGISHFLEHMVFKGTKHRNVREIAQSLESLGGYLNAFTTKEQTCFYARVLDSDIGQAMDVLADILLNATFEKREMEREKLVVIEELKNAEDDPEDIIHDYFERSIFPEHSLGFPIIGTEENVRQFRREHLRSHVAEHFLPSRLVISAAGHVDHDMLVRLVSRYFRRLRPQNGDQTRIAGPVRSGKGTMVEYARPINQAHVCLGTLAYSVSHPDRYTLMLANALLGEGMSSRLYQTIREKHGLAYTVYSFVNLLSDTGVFGAYLGTDRKNVRAAIDLVYHELDKLKKRPVPMTEMQRTKSQIKGTMMLGLENMSGRMIRLGSAELYVEQYVSLDSILQRVDAVTPEDIQRVANDLFVEDRFSAVIIKPS